MSTPDDPISTLPQAAEFLHAVEAVLPAYRYGLFSYVAFLLEDNPIILRARLELKVGKPLELAPRASTTSLRAGQVLLPIAPSAVWTCIQRAAAADWLPPIEDQLLKLLPRAPVEGSQGFSAYYDHIDRSRSENRCDSDRFILSGTNIQLLIRDRSKDLERELRQLGLDSLHDLMRVYGLGGSDHSSFEITCDPVATIQGTLQNRRLNIRVSLAKGLNPENFRITARNADPNSAGMPTSMRGREISWCDHDNERDYGSWEFTLPTSAIMDCWAVYAGRLEAEVRLADLGSLPNARRMSIELVDPELVRLRALLTRPTGKQRDDFESAVSLLFQILGFAPAHIGAMSGWTHEPDIFVTCPKGETLIVECTTDVPDDDKLMMLVSRTARLREFLERTPEESRPADPIPMLVTPCAREELAPLRDKAERHGVVILSRPEIEAAIARSQFEPDANAVLEGWRQLSLVQFLTGGRLD